MAWCRYCEQQYEPVAGHSCPQAAIGNVPPALPAPVLTKTVADLLHIARSALADITRSTDMSKDQLQAKANRVYWETEPSDEPISALQARFTCEGKHCHRSFVIKYETGAKIMGASCVCGHYTAFKEPALRAAAGIAPGMLDGVLHDVDCAALHTPAFSVKRRDCDCGALKTPEPSANPDVLDAARYRWLRDGNAYAPEEEMVRGGEELDELCDERLAVRTGATHE